jgi:alkylhydroperoxidase family enzyme
MKPRMNFYQAAPDTVKALSALEAQIQASGLEQSLIELVKTRASQINGCAYCITCIRKTRASTAKPSSGCIC